MATVAELKKHGFNEEIGEQTRGTFKATGHPEPLKRLRLHYEAYNISIEEPYFYILHYLRYYSGFPEIEKITDVFAAAENSSFFGNSQQKLGAQQDKVSQFMATIGKMVRELFQLVRELRVLDERLGYYHDSFDQNSKSQESAEITLKGIWVDLVEQGAKNPASVYGMAREVQFTTLPDLFFSTHPQKSTDVDVVVERDRGAFNNKVKEVLKRKLRTFLAWKEHTFEEMKNRRVFTLKFLRQHYEAIRMYINWVKPYLKNIQRLTLDQKKTETPDLLIAFESSMIEVEIMARKPMGKFNSVLLLTYNYRTRPEMNYRQEYNQGPLHLGRVEIDFRAYAWNEEQIRKYKMLREQEDFQLLSLIDASMRAAMESLGDELMRYLEEAGEEMHPEQKRSDQSDTPKGFMQTLHSFLGAKSHKPKSAKPPKPKKETQTSRMLEGKARASAGTHARGQAWTIYHHFKKHHEMLNW